jgi:uncharacterized membrane protein YeaQ/YmgE (transglycosylase-associated protein family)
MASGVAGGATATNRTNNRAEVKEMGIGALLVFLAIGAVAGWLAGKVMKGGGFGLLGNMVVGVIGAVVGGMLFDLLGISANGLLGAIITATVGAIVLLYVVRLLKKV